MNERKSRLPGTGGFPTSARNDVAAVPPRQVIMPSGTATVSGVSVVRPIGGIEATSVARISGRQLHELTGCGWRGRDAADGPDDERDN